jgi:hypothetical protein
MYRIVALTILAFLFSVPAIAQSPACEITLDDSIAALEIARTASNAGNFGAALGQISSVQTTLAQIQQNCSQDATTQRTYTSTDQSFTFEYPDTWWAGSFRELSQEGIGSLISVTAATSSTLVNTYGPSCLSEAESQAVIVYLGDANGLLTRFRSGGAQVPQDQAIDFNTFLLDYIQPMLLGTLDASGFQRVSIQGEEAYQGLITSSGCQLVLLIMQVSDTRYAALMGNAADGSNETLMATMQTIAVSLEINPES